MKVKSDDKKEFEINNENENRNGYNIFIDFFKKYF